jgi:hypothetical protein
MTVEERYEDRECLAGLVRTEAPARLIKRSWGLQYRFDPAQETKLHEGSDCLVAGTDLGCSIESLDESEGLVELKVGPGKRCPTGSASSRTSSLGPIPSSRPSRDTPRRGSGARSSPRRWTTSFAAARPESP